MAWIAASQLSAAVRTARVFSCINLLPRTLFGSGQTCRRGDAASARQRTAHRSCGTHGQTGLSGRASSPGCDLAPPPDERRQSDLAADWETNLPPPVQSKKLVNVGRAA